MSSIFQSSIADDGWQVTEIGNGAPIRAVEPLHLVNVEAPPHCGKTTLACFVASVFLFIESVFGDFDEFGFTG